MGPLRQNLVEQIFDSIDSEQNKSVHVDKLSKNWYIQWNILTLQLLSTIKQEKCQLSKSKSTSYQC
jgi:hypothetical protein